MRDVFCRTLVAAAGNPNFVFLTGDLGFKALEPLQEALGERFINAGVSEQNMVSLPHHGALLSVDCRDRTLLDDPAHSHLRPGAKRKSQT